MAKERGVICVFSKAPVVGKVKTRLIPALGPEGACDFYKTLVLKTLETACYSDLFEVHLYCTPTTDNDFFRSCEKNFPLTLHLQKGNDLGQRMYRAVSDISTKHPFSIVLGCDCPWLKTEDLLLAQEKLHSDNEIVIGPANDGGYYLLGGRRFDKYLFSGINWGSASVLEQTRLRLDKLRISYFELSAYSDIDREEDLNAYLQHLESRVIAAN